MLCRRWRRLGSSIRGLRRARPSEAGVSLIEVLLGMLIFGVVAVTFLGGVGTGTRATALSSDSVTADSLVRSQAEYVKGLAYQYDTSSYPVDPTIVLPAGWSLPAPHVEPLDDDDEGIQEVTISAVRNGETVLSIVVYKVDR